MKSGADGYKGVHEGMGLVVKKVNRRIQQNVTVVACDECASQHHLVVGHMTVGNGRRMYQGSECGNFPNRR